MGSKEKWELRSGSSGVAMCLILSRAGGIYGGSLFSFFSYVRHSLRADWKPKSKGNMVADVCPLHWREAMGEWSLQALLSGAQFRSSVLLAFLFCIGRWESLWRIVFDNGGNADGW